MLKAGNAQAMATITIDNRQYEVDDGQNLLSACLSLKKNLPYFCWHPALGSVGACRQCAVVLFKDADDQRGTLVMSCMTPVKDGAIYSIDAPTAQDFRAGIIENLMTNHPHDCPVCEEGGECHLQDMTLMSGHTQRRFQGRKRTHNNQYLGPFINHEMNRCITCYRCVRFYRDHAGGTDLQALGRNHQVYFGRQEDGLLDNGFSGNLVEVCPTGVFTDKTYSRHYVRKWDLQTAPSVCEHCAVGCNTAPGARRDGKGDPRQLRRVTNLFHRQINGYFLCDRGRFGYEYANSAARIYTPQAALTQPLIQTTAGSAKVHQSLSPADAVARLAVTIAQMRSGNRRVIGIGSSRSSLENNFALQTLVGREHFYAGLDERSLALLKLVDRIQRDPRVHSPGTPEIERADMVIVLGEDIADTAPRIALAVRQAARSAQIARAGELKIPAWQDDSVRQLTGIRTPLLVASAERTDLDDIASCRVRAAPEQMVALADVLAQALTAESGEIHAPDIAGLDTGEFTALVEQLKQARHPVIVSGCGLQSQELLQAAARLAFAVAGHKEANHRQTDSREARAALYLACPEANSLGLAQLCDARQNLNQLHRERQSEHTPQPTTLLVMEADLYRQLPASVADQLCAGVDEIIQLEIVHNRTSARADLILPAAATPEYEGTLVNSGGLAQRHYAVYEGSGWIQASWRWLADAAAASGELAGAELSGDEETHARLQSLARWRHVTQLSVALAESYPELAPLAELGPDWDQTIEGQKTARQPHRYSGRTAIQAERQVAEYKPLPDDDAPMAFSMEGIQFACQSPLQANNWAPGWNSNQAIHCYQPKPGAARLGHSSGQPLARKAVVFHSDSAAGDAARPTADPSDGFRILPLYRMFGSGELSNYAGAIASVTEEPFAVFHPQDLELLSLTAGQQIAITESGDRWQLLAKVSDTIPRHCIGVSTGFTQMASIPGAYIEREQIAPGDA
ncbi:NADH-quinone oxidoreductase subunit NuoG [Microbulbifer harenosus]|uniref:NADH-quinone oxidoreductase n=2 Tax=Microbulbifer harenosus TaxID=2576840 RepID=A0ABY2UMA5_9GAMM|nr:NADH-quinone oxidoreductase subunit NuoG [Microbulbifer harenosus]